jgi:hypothetical protein
MDYLAQWRLNLRVGDSSVDRGQCRGSRGGGGYGSEAAFNRAFKRSSIVRRRSSAASVTPTGPALSKEPPVLTALLRNRLLTCAA